MDIAKGMGVLAEGALMAMEAWGGNLSPGRAATELDEGETHISRDRGRGTMGHWISSDGIDRHGLAGRLRSPTKLEFSLPCSVVSGGGGW
jgi:hypothetical protein